MTIGIARGGPENGRIIVHIGDEKPGLELRETGRYVFDRATTDWKWKESDVGSMKDLLGDTPAVYPHAPGFKESTTSRDAAKAVASDAATLREQVFQEIAAAGARGLTADEAAMKLDRSILSVRPRVSELANAAPPRIVRTGERRSNGSRLLAAVWRAACV